MIYFILIQLITVFVFLYLYINRKYSYWSGLGVKGPAPSVFKCGNISQIQGQDPLKVELEFLQTYGTTYGTYTLFEPTLTVSDPKLIKDILIKNFASFVNRRKIKTYHDMVNNGLFFTNGEIWKRLRTISSPSFTTGKLKKFTPMMHQCIDHLEQYFNQLAASGGVMENTRTTIMGFSIETIASTVFSSQTNSNDDRQQQNPFVSNGIKVSDVSSFQALSYFVMPKWFNNLFNVEHPFNVESIDFYTNAVRSIIKQQKDGGNQTNLVHLLMNSAKENYVKTSTYDGLTASMDREFTENSTGKSSGTSPATLSESEVIGIATGIFLAGFDTTALTISSCLYELSFDQEIQERLFQELVQSLDGLTIESEEYFDVTLTKIHFLDAVIKETLRKYPVLARLERRLQADNYKLDGIPLVKDQLIEISTVAVHYNSQFYPEPFKFNPDRFMPVNKHLLVPYTFIPFGDGPRNCMGMRYAYQEIKLCLSRILRQFRFEATPETPKQLKFLPFKFVLSPQPFPIRVVKRC